MVLLIYGDKKKETQKWDSPEIPEVLIFPTWAYIF